MFKILLYEPDTKKHFLLKFEGVMYSGSSYYQKVTWRGMTPNSGYKTYTFELHKAEVLVSEATTEVGFYTNNPLVSKLIRMNDTTFKSVNASLTTLLSDFGVTKYVIIFDRFDYGFTYKHDNNVGEPVQTEYGFRICTLGENGFSNDSVSGNWGQYIVIDKDGIIKKVDNVRETDTPLAHGIGSTASLNLTFKPYPQRLDNNAQLDPNLGIMIFDTNGYGGNGKFQIPYRAEPDAQNIITVPYQPVGTSWVVYDYNEAPYRGYIMQENDKLTEAIENIDSEVQDLADEINYVEGNVTSKFVSR